MYVEVFDYSTEDRVGEAISSGMRRHQNTKYFNCGRIGKWKMVIDMSTSEKGF